MMPSDITVLDKNKIGSNVREQIEASTIKISQLILNRYGRDIEKVKQEMQADDGFVHQNELKEFLMKNFREDIAKQQLKLGDLQGWMSHL
jgi:hypothetical protein